MATNMNCSGVVPAQHHKTGHNQQSDNAAPQDNFTGFIVSRGKLNANPHATK